MCLANEEIQQTVYLWDLARCFRGYLNIVTVAELTAAGLHQPGKGSVMGSFMSCWY